MIESVKKRVFLMSFFFARWAIFYVLTVIKICISVGEGFVSVFEGLKPLYVKIRFVGNELFDSQVFLIATKYPFLCYFRPSSPKMQRKGFCTVFIWHSFFSRVSQEIIVQGKLISSSCCQLFWFWRWSDWRKIGNCPPVCQILILTSPNWKLLRPRAPELPIGPFCQIRFRWGVVQNKIDQSSVMLNQQIL